MGKKLFDNRKKIIESFEEYVISQSSKDDYWKSVGEIAQISGSTSKDVLDVIKYFDEFKRNRHGEYTTIRLYIKYTPFFQKVIHAYQRRID
ncbi:MAG: hypothetical protein IIA88_01085 [Bacteroidetes bacterium]|nr:hypothetical protein [Bacteroidota bacterium]